jgi:hypothetical protein
MIGSELIPDVGIIVSTVEATSYTRRTQDKEETFIVKAGLDTKVSAPVDT